MREASLIRITPTASNFPTAGVLRLNGEPFAVTLEPPFYNGYPDQHPQIPTGEYICKKTLDRKTTGGLYIPITFEVTNVPKRSGILFHIGNYRKDTKGCILLGTHFGRTDSKQIMVRESRLAFEAFINEMEKEEEFKLKVIQA